MGVRSVNPDAEVRVVWTNTWFDPPQEKAAAEAETAKAEAEAPAEEPSADETPAEEAAAETPTEEVADEAHDTSVSWSDRKKRDRMREKVLLMKAK